MKRIAALFAIALLLAGCETAPVTGRTQFVLMPENQAAEMGREAYQQILNERGVSRDRQLNAIVQEVGSRIARVSDRPDLNWQFTVIADDTPNAFALPGGYVGVNEGLFRVAQNEDQLATVIAHEIAHVVARHPAERVSRQAVVQTGVGALVGQTGPMADVAAAAATLGLVLPFSREQEAEADAIGLQYMARAGYDPRAAVALWQNFETYGGPGAPAFLSTHPPAGDRIARLEALMPEALAIYEAAGGR